ncbi:MAG TPA: RNA polymerase sigma factor RpoD/SigA [Prolixibacteraceae bacterium]|jgi:RNA polymerase primary sigma factor
MRQLKIAQQVTNRDAISLDKYLHEIGRFELIKAEEEVELARRIKKGDKAALEKLIKANLRFVVSVAKQYQHQGVALPDLINEGNMGLIKAAQLFDETRGFKFISYAVWWIRQSILQSLAEHSRIVRLPLNKIGLITKINKTYNRLEQEFQYDPSSDEVAMELDTSPEIIEDVLRLSTHSMSVDAPIHDEEGTQLYDVIYNEDSPSPEGGLMKSSLYLEIERWLSTLAERESDVIRYFYGLCGHRQLSLQEISIELDLTTERVRQIKEKTIRKMKNNCKNKLLKAYL